MRLALLGTVSTVILLTTAAGCSLFHSKSDYTYPDYPDIHAAAAVHYGGLPPTELHRAIENHEIIMGMNFREVKAVWGQPREIETIGPGWLENQKWTYGTNVLTREQLRPIKVVYFENGRVAGWENAGL